MATQTDDLQGIDQALEPLEFTEAEKVEQPKSVAVDQAPETEEFVVPESVGSPGGAGDLPRPMMGMINAGIGQMATMEKVREFPEFFLRLAQTTGLRLLLLKRWTSGLQVFMEENIQLPAEAKKKRRDGRAPIPSTDSDIFQAITDDASIYAGPVPAKYFPLDLTLMLGRGSRDRQIIILPLPSQNHWNTFLYLDADQGTEKFLAVAEVLARFALTRMCLLNKDDRKSGGKVEAILQAELKRRQENPTEEPFGSETAVPLDTSPAEAQPEPVAEDSPPEETTDTWKAEAEPAATKTSETGPVVHGNMTPEAILHHSGELPALPKAACHIMAVIEDPGTTATKLEHALAMDQALTAKVLRIANSPFYGAVREIRTVSEAVVRLGFVAIRNWTLVAAARSVFLAPGAGMLYQRIWKQSVLSAMSAQIVAQTVGGREPGRLVLSRATDELLCSLEGDAHAELHDTEVGIAHRALEAAPYLVLAAEAEDDRASLRCRGQHPDGVAAEPSQLQGLAVLDGLPEGGQRTHHVLVLHALHLPGHGDAEAQRQIQGSHQHAYMGLDRLGLTAPQGRLGQLRVEPAHHQRRQAPLRDR